MTVYFKHTSNIDNREITIYVLADNFEEKNMYELEYNAVYILLYIKMSLIISQVPYTSFSRYIMV